MRVTASIRVTGRALPDVEIVFHDVQDGCKGHDGLFQRQYIPWRAQVCSELTVVLTHELAHAWEAANLDDDDRAAYTEQRGLPTWSSKEYGWNDRAIEDAAFIMQQNLMAGHVDPTSDRWIERLDAYEALTGMTSPALAV